MGKIRTTPTFNPPFLPLARTCFAASHKEFEKSTSNTVSGLLGELQYPQTY
jgi:hypothetical protein